MDKQKSLSDTALVELATKNPESFGILMERYQGPLFHYIRRIAQLSKEDTEDLLQEVFIKIYQKLNEYNDELKFSSWAYRIAHNHVIDYFRKTSARPRTNSLEDSEWEKLIHSSVHVEKDIADGDCAKKIKICIGNLPVHYREVLILRFIEEKEYEEIMDILKKPKGTVATLIKRGKEMLVKRLEEENINCF
ncbi:MAG: ECF subfamily RNA polymerase sigma factor, RNA polymerase sigma-70 factor, ECF subfamily [Candidatus Moranbacteria bacterium GW2011_GWC1_45_18]|nr:MAG: RNA polymerase, sigma-24 subunit, ECF subfamily [Candidatus Moranbacteria bacterium GW2011_GWC2_40_12]KKT33623.1 MAG: RNA polymerase, sigma-24 subunit, ECF subfamily [Candidatus Moranbacteria bacterium GW2011_GWF2_44_10]KKT72311.1 MAG: RNA polymerase, sigma-24 subunit, ECF subfamily [Candidatus Moranbacteria bacterium GW2011_GWF1_44_4]KKT99471.1 MAG: ECF subfamily RNA polymerase sigma factor, RNA polymerase sigma-70 factor, ECF subfamily [Candidatus Moranbacteria bacterium GW2011_GWC1_45